jgi:DNA-binding GntR family transcriptional regulator
MSEERYRLNSTLSRRVTALELVRDALLNAILRGDLPGDSRLVQTEIAAELGVSTTPVREAMRELAIDGLIVLDSHRIGTVRRPDWQEMSDIVAMKQALEKLAIRKSVPNMTSEDLDGATQIAEELANDGLDLGTWVQLNIDFHSLFHNATNSSRMASVLISLEKASGVYVAQAQRWQPEIRQQGIRDHFLLIDAYKKGDVERAIQIEHEHATLPLHASELSDGLAEKPTVGSNS